jgi:hypothetical protein
LMTHAYLRAREGAAPLKRDIRKGELVDRIQSPRSPERGPVGSPHPRGGGCPDGTVTLTVSAQAGKAGGNQGFVGVGFVGTALVDAGFAASWICLFASSPLLPACSSNAWNARGSVPR